MAESISPKSLITEADVKSTLLADKGSGAVLTSWSTEDFTKKGDHYAGSVTSVVIKYSQRGTDKDMEVKYVAKLNPCRKTMLGLTQTVFMKEGRFYLELLPELNAILTAHGAQPLRLPTCLHANLEPGKERIYFKDLRERGFKTYDRMKGLDNDHTVLVLREMARLHATSCILQERNPSVPLEEAYDFLARDILTYTDTIRPTMIKIFEGHLAKGADMLRKAKYNEKAISWVESLIPKVEELMEAGLQSKRFGCINHGDCWNNNFLFRYNSEEKPIDVILLDLQLCRKVSLAIDLNYFLYSGLTGEVRSPNLGSFLSTYYSTYKDVIETGGAIMDFTEEELLKEFRDKNIYGPIFAMIIIPVLLRNTTDIPDASEEENMSVEERTAKRSAKDKQMFDQNPMLRSRFLSIFDELMEAGIIS